MSFYNYLTKIVTLTKRNHRYYGPTESNKFRGSLTEVACDLGTIFGEYNNIEDSVVALASGYLEPSGSIYSLYDLKRQVYHLEDRLEHLIYVQAKQTEVIE